MTINNLIKHNFGFIFTILMTFVVLVLFGSMVSANGLQDQDEHDEEHVTMEGIVEMQPKPEETHHFEVKPETLDGQRIPYMAVTVTATAKGTGAVIEKELHPMFGGGFHYGANLALPGEEYILKFHLEPPSADMVRGSARKDQWLKPLDFEFVFNAKEEFDHSIEIGKATTEDMNIFFETEHAESMWMLAGGDDSMDHDVTQEVPGQTSRATVTFLIIGIVGALVFGFFLGKFKKVSV